MGARVGVCVCKCTVWPANQLEADIFSVSFTLFSFRVWCQSFSMICFLLFLLGFFFFFFFSELVFLI